MLTIERATLEDLDDILGLLNGARAWFQSKGIEQWPNEFTIETFAPYIGCGDMWIVRNENRQPQGTIRISFEPERVFWTDDECSAMAGYISRMAVAEPGTGSGVGAKMLRWACDHAAQLGYQLVRLDCRRDNDALISYYGSRGWGYVRTEVVPGRFSGALFQRPAELDPPARELFSRYRIGGWLDPGDLVTVDGQGAGVVSSLHPVAPESGEASLYDGVADLGLPGYRIRLDDGPEVLVPRARVKLIKASASV